MPQIQMPAVELRKNFTLVAERLAGMRDEALAEAKVDADPYLQRLYKREASAYRLALSALHIWTHGEFGQTLEDQPGAYGDAATR
ncbi:hypothetical protein ABZ863_05465 [Saccharomonospora sp. NPDC046836]|uniref:hypothetical protein n=1 Tax=Saccharomonospora sp. NPDC046836 TaxID=3156921 RepID=UPI0033C3ECA6